MQWCIGTVNSVERTALAFTRFERHKESEAVAKVIEQCCILKCLCMYVVYVCVCQMIEVEEA
jgi:hypothetical protein